MQTENNRKLMSPFRRGTYILSVLAGLFCLFGLYALSRSSPVKTGAKAATSFDGNWNPARDSLNLLLNDGQCTEAFSGLFADINRAIEDRGGMQVSIAELERVPRINGYVRGMIYNQEVRSQT
jgi:hypothetical protein